MTKQEHVAAVDKLHQEHASALEQVGVKAREEAEKKIQEAKVCTYIYIYIYQCISDNLLPSLGTVEARASKGD